MRLRSAIIQAAVIVATVTAVAGLAFAVRERLGWQSALISVVDLLFVSVALVGGALLRRRAANRTGWVFLVAGTLLPVSNLLGELVTAAYHGGYPLPARAFFGLAAMATTVLSIFLLGTLGVLWFPDGKSSSRLLTWVCYAELATLLFWTLFSTPMTMDQTIANPLARPPWLASAAAVGGVSIVAFTPVTVLATVALFRKARRQCDLRARAGLRLAAWCAASVPLAFAVCIAVSFAGLDNNNVTALENTSGLIIGIGAWVGIRRYGLLDVRVVLNRALVYGALSVVVAAAYLLVSLALGELISGILPHLLGTGLAVTIALPLQNRLQRWVNSLVYGLRDEPAAALVQLGARLDEAAAIDDVLPAAVRIVADVLRLRFVEVRVVDEVLAAYGEREGANVERIPLPFAGETVGEMVLQSRDEGGLARSGRPGPALETLAGQIAVAVRAVVSSRALVASRETLILAREEERQRLRRDLHDGVGPDLAAISLRMEGAARAIDAGDPGRAAGVLTNLHQEIHRTLDTVRRIAYELRPPILDELGLAAALQEHALRLGISSGGIPSDLPRLPAAFEVATYRIAVEAMTNSVRHARGAEVDVRLRVNGRVELEVRDHGPGLTDWYVSGVGITSMRERAAELGGTCTVCTVQPTGTLVRTILPLKLAPVTES